MRSRIKALFAPAPLNARYADAADFMRVACVGFIGWYHIWQLSWLNPNLTIGGRTLRFFPLVAGGYMFVDLLLTLSGFLLMLGYLSGRNRRAGDFYLARAARILPSYLLCIFVMLFAYALPGKLFFNARHLWTDLLSHLTFTHNLFYDAYYNTRLNGALWTLAVEVQFYLLFPLIGRAFARRPAASYVGLTLLAQAFRLAVIRYTESSFMYIIQLPAMLDLYANGMLAALLFHKLAASPQRAWRAWLSTLLAVAAAIGVYLLINFQIGHSGQEALRESQMYLRWPLSAIGGIFLLCGSRSIGLLRALLSNRLTRFLSAISFNFYIWHQFIATRLKAWRIPPYAGDAPNKDGLQPWQSQYTLLCFAGALLTAILLTYALEKPCARWMKRRRASDESA